jgi:hypothetical protein
VEVVNRYDIFKPLLKDFGNRKSDRIILKLILKEQGDRVRTECLKLVQDTVECRNLVNYLRSLKILVIFRAADELYLLKSECFGVHVTHDAAMFIRWTKNCRNDGGFVW